MTTTTTALTTDDPASPCGPDCIYLDGACRCRHGEIDTTPMPAELASIVPPF